MQAHPQSFSSKSIKLPGLARAAQGEINWSQSERWRTFPIQGERDQAGKQSWPWETVSAGRRSWSSMWTARLLDGGIFPRHPENPIHELQLGVTPGSRPTRTSAFRLDWHPTLGCLPAQSPPGLGFQSPFPPTPCHAHGKDEAPPVVNSMEPNPAHRCRAAANWTLIQNSLLLLLGRILKVTGEARQGETNVCHLPGPPGHVHTSNLVTPQEIIPLEGTGSRFSIPSSQFLLFI